MKRFWQEFIIEANTIVRKCELQVSIGGCKLSAAAA